MTNIMTTTILEARKRQGVKRNHHFTNHLEKSFKVQTDLKDEQQESIMAAPRVDVFLLVLFIYYSVCYVKKTYYVTEDGISYTLGTSNVIDLNEKHYGYTSLWVLKKKHSFTRCYSPRSILCLLLLTSGDIEICPGPKYTCTNCTKTIRKNQKFGCCSNCSTRCHLKCMQDLNLDGNAMFFCNLCQINNNINTEKANFLNKDFQYFINSKGLKIIHQNVNGIVGKMDSIRLLLSDSKQKIGFFCITETHTNSSVKNIELQVPGYTFERMDRSNGPHGGVLCYIRPKSTKP